MKMETAAEDHDDGHNAHNNMGYNLNLANPDNNGHNQGAGDGQAMTSAQMPSKPNSSKNKKADGRDERAHSQASKQKPANQSANDTIDANSNAHPKVKQSLTGKQLSNNGQHVRASISKEVSTSQNQHTVQPRQTSKKFDNCVTKFAFATKTGYSPKNPNKINQDSFLVLPHLGEYRRTHFFAVADGHGVNGKLVSEFVKTVLAKEVEQSIKYTFDQAKIN